MELRGGGGAGELRRFRRLVEITALATFVLIVIGGIVRVSESGLGCGPAGSGTEGWPLCGGEVIPFIHDTKVLIEFSHRLTAGVVAILIALVAWRAWRRLPGYRWALRGSIAAGALVLVQAGLGGLTVENNLHELLVAAHLTLAMLLLGLVLWLATMARRAEEAEGISDRAPPRPVRGLRAPAALTAVLVLAAIAAGGYVAGTEEEGVENGVVGGAHLACGEQFPGCANQGLLPFGESRLIDIQLTHRALVYGATVALLGLLGLAYARGSRDWTLAVAGGLLVLQFGLGVLNVLTGKHATLVVAHLTAGTLLWSAVLLIAYRLAWAPAAATARANAGEARTTAVPA